MADPLREKPRVARGVYSRRFTHGVTWYIRYTVGGRIVREKIGREADGITRTQAAAALKARLGDVVRGQFRLPQARRALPVRQLVERYGEYAKVNKRGYSRERYTLGQLAREFGLIPLGELSAFRIEKWKAARRRDVAAATVNRELTILMAMLGAAVRWKLLERNPASDVRPLPVSNARLRFLTADELARLLAAARRDVAAPWLVPAIELAVRTGLRQGELLRLRWTDLDAGRRLATILQTKNNTPRHVPLNAANRWVAHYQGATILVA